MKIKMLRNALGSNDGHTVHHYVADETYEVSDDLGKSFIADKAAELAGDEPAPIAYEEGEIYVLGGETFIGAVVEGVPGVGLLPIAQLTDEERAALVAEGKLTEDGQPVAAKAVEAAPKNKAIAKAPKNKAK